MSISELLAHVGDSDVRVQSLDQCATHIQGHAASVHITFGSDCATAADLVKDGKLPMLGLVVWIPRDKVPKLDT